MVILYAEFSLFRNTKNLIICHYVPWKSLWKLFPSHFVSSLPFLDSPYSISIRDLNYDANEVKLLRDASNSLKLLWYEATLNQSINIVAIMDKYHYDKVHF